MKTYRILTVLTVTLFLAAWPVHPACAMMTEEVAEAATRVPVELSGHVIDDATGKPLPYFAIQGGYENHWYWLQMQESTPNGAFSIWAPGGWARIVAMGYLSQPILMELPQGGVRKISGLVVRIKRGRKVSGHVFDYTGKPVNDAGVYVLNSLPLNFTGGKTMLDAAVEDSNTVRVATDAAGAFAITGLGGDAQRIAVTSSALDLWVVPVPQGEDANVNLDIHLPQPGKLVVHYDIAGAPDKAKLFMRLYDWEIPGWSGVRNERYAFIQQHVECALDNLPPGKYLIDRVKNLGMGDKR